MPGFGFLPTTEFCLLQGKHGGFEHERKVDSVYLDPMAYREFAFLDMLDAGQEIASQDGSQHVLKQGIACGYGQMKWTLFLKRGCGL